MHNRFEGDETLNREELFESVPVLKKLSRGEETVWINPDRAPAAEEADCRQYDEACSQRGIYCQ